MIQLNKSYIDEMDRARKVIPVELKGNQVVCKVFWRQTSGNGTDTWLFDGKTTLPVSLFNAKPGLGFVIPATIVVQSPLKSFEEIAGDQLK